MKTVAMALLALTVGACSSETYEPPTYAAVDRSAQTWGYCGPEEHHDGARLAVLWWAMNGQPMFIERKCEDAAIQIRVESKFDSDGHWGFAWSEPERARVELYIPATLSPRRFQSVLRHELGHVFGLGHTTDPGCMMFPSRGDGLPMDLCRSERDVLGLL
jgi:hypothetical protein